MTINRLRAAAPWSKLFQFGKCSEGQACLFCQILQEDLGPILTVRDHMRGCWVKISTHSTGVASKAGMGDGYISLVHLGRIVRVRFLTSWHHAHEPHQSAEALLVHKLALVLQVSCHLPDAVALGFHVKIERKYVCLDF